MHIVLANGCFAIYARCCSVGRSHVFRLWRGMSCIMRREFDVVLGTLRIGDEEWSGAVTVPRFLMEMCVLLRAESLVQANVNQPSVIPADTRRVLETLVRLAADERRRFELLESSCPREALCVRLGLMELASFERFVEWVVVQGILTIIGHVNPLMSMCVEFDLGSEAAYTVAPSSMRMALLVAYLNMVRSRIMHVYRSELISKFRVI